MDKSEYLLLCLLLHAVYRPYVLVVFFVIESPLQSQLSRDSIIVRMVESDIGNMQITIQVAVSI